MLRRIGRRPRVVGPIIFVATIAMVLFVVPTAFAGVAGAGFTTDNPAVTAACLNGGAHSTPAVNCNIYTSKQDVWINGGPSNGANHLTDGSYFFAVLEPGGQPDPNDGGLKNLSDISASGGTNDTCGDAYTNRTFTVSGGHISAYSGDGSDYYGGATGDPANADPCTGNGSADPHALDTTDGGSLGDLIQLWPYDTTGNPGGVYILAICSLAGGYPVDPRDCKYDAFKVQTGTPGGGGPPPATGAVPTKGADGSYTTTYTWGITKAACAHGVSGCKTTVDASSGNVSFDYTITLTSNGGTNSAIEVTGTIDVINGNTDQFGNTVPMSINSLTDSLSDGTSCTVTGAPSGGGGTVTLSDFDTQFAYECDLTALPQGSLDNTVTVGWDAQDLNLSGDTTNLSHLAAGSNDFTFKGISFTQTKVGNCVTVTDTFNGGSALTLGTFCEDGTSSSVDTTLPVTATPTWTLTYTRSIAVLPDQCKSYLNTATFSGADVTSGLKGSDSATVTICGPASGGLTMGFWQNKNGQGIITGQAKTGVCPSGTWLRQDAPFQDLSATATCAQVATYVYNVIKAATCSTGGTCNTMLKAQMLATALDVYFSDPALGGDKIAAFNGGNTVKLGSVNVDLTHICKMIDSSGGGSCSGSFENTSSAFGGATCLSVSQLLTTAAGYSNVGGTIWYGTTVANQNKATQVLAKDTFDSVNNQVASTC